MPRPTLLRWTPAHNSGANRPRSLSLLALGIGLAACSGSADPLPATGGASGTANSSAGASAAGSGAGGSGGLPGAAGTTLGGSAGSTSLAGGAGTNTAGAGGGSSGAGGGSSAIDASFNGFKSLIPTSCFGSLCHDLPEHPLQLKVDDQLYTTLTTHVTKECGPLITKGSPQQSALVKLLKGPCGKTDRMPYGKCISDGDEGCVSPENIAAIEQWITQGAPQ